MTRSIGADQETFIVAIEWMAAGSMDRSDLRPKVRLDLAKAFD